MLLYAIRMRCGIRHAPVDAEGLQEAPRIRGGAVFFRVEKAALLGIVPAGPLEGCRHSRRNAYEVLETQYQVSAGALTAE
jgi:hypothetical protein